MLVKSKQIIFFVGVSKFPVSESIIAEIKVNACSKTDIKLSCPSCNEEFATLKELDSHKLNFHNIKSLYPCDICGEVYIYSDMDLTNHKKLKHPVVEKEKIKKRTTRKRKSNSKVGKKEYRKLKYNLEPFGKSLYKYLLKIQLKELKFHLSNSPF